MSLDWVSRKSAIKQAFALALGLNQAGGTLLADGTYTNPSDVEWENQREANRMVGGVWVDLRLGPVVVVDDDEIRYNTFGDGTVEGTQLLPTYGGRRMFTVTAMIGTDDQTDLDAIGTVAAKLRTRIWREEVQDILSAQRIGTIKVFQTINADYAEDGVMYSMAVVEVKFNTVEFDAPDPETDTGSFIARVEGHAEDLDPGDHQPTFDVSIDTVEV